MTPVYIPAHEWKRPEGRVSVRPWWEATYDETWKVYTRRPDEAEVHSNPVAYPWIGYGVPAGVSEEDWNALRAKWEHTGSEPTLMAAIDDAFPLPFPGVRDGQVWWVPPGVGLDGQPPSLGQTIRPFQKYRGGWTVGSFGLRDDEAEALFKRCILLHDPLRPDLAPWAPKGVELAMEDR